MKSKYLILITAVLLISCKTNKNTDTQITQTKEATNIEEIINAAYVDTTKVYTIVEQMPAFPRGEAELMNFVMTNIRVPSVPEDKMQENTSTAIRFVVTRTGTIRDIEPTQDRYKGTILTDSLTSVIKRMPRWIPGKQNGVNVDVYFTLPLHVNLKR
jgi:protein TonB